MEQKRMLLTVKEVASILRLSLTETYKLVQSGAIVHYRVGPGKGAIRIEEDEVQVFLKNRQIGGGERAAVAVPMRTKPLKHIRPKK